MGSCHSHTLFNAHPDLNLMPTDSFSDPYLFRILIKELEEMWNTSLLSCLCRQRRRYTHMKEL